MGLLGEKLKEAFENKGVNINAFVWKGGKSVDASGNVIQNKVKMVDMTEEQLRGAFLQCHSMLFNSDVQKPGRYVVLDTISEQKDKCGAELFIRFIEQNTEMSRFTLLNAINDFLRNNQEAFKTIKPCVGHLFKGISPDFETIPLNLVVEGCIDRLGLFDKKHIARSFILRQGVWFTPEESEDLEELNDFGKLKNKLEVVKERLNIKESEEIKVNPSGLNYTQLRSMIELKKARKYTYLTTNQLETLRYRVLFNLEEDVRKHIFFWEGKIKEIELVANKKGYKNVV